MSDLANSKSGAVFATTLNARNIVLDAGGVVVRDATIAKIHVLKEGLRVPVILFTHENIAELVASVKSHTKQTCMVDNVEYPFIALKKGDAVFESLYADQENPSSWKMDSVVDFNVDCLRLSECLGGTRIIFHAPTSSGYHEVFRDVEGELHLFIRTIPTGVLKTHYPKKVFGLDVVTEAGYYEHFYPVPGRGVSLSDGEEDVVQIVGNNIYLLFDPFYVIEEKKDIGFTIFRKSLVLALNHLQETQSTETEVAPVPTEAEVGELIDSYMEAGLSVFKKDISALENKIKEQEERLIALRDDMRALTRINRLLIKDGLFGGELRERLLSDHARICAHPLVEKAFIVPKTGYEAETRQICITHEGVTRKIGRYSLRFLFNGRLFISTIETHHPKSVPHPHVSAWNGPCFGNMKRSIEDACREYRYADAVELVLAWLSDGYSPELIIFNWVEEWPPLSATQPKEVL